VILLCSLNLCSNIRASLHEYDGRKNSRMAYVIWLFCTAPCEYGVGCGIVIMREEKQPLHMGVMDVEEDADSDIRKDEIMAYTDCILTCRDCGKEFVFTAGEQEFYSQKGFLNNPVRCPECRRARKQARQEDSRNKPARTHNHRQRGNNESAQRNDRRGFEH
jgi:ssDNA-binding Zn-finger/Zn-ribbon topoisomerase 1